MAGLCFTEIAALFALDGAINQHAFQTFVTHVLVPEFRSVDVVVMDNLSSHKGPRVRDVIEGTAVGLRYLSP